MKPNGNEFEHFRVHEFREMNMRTTKRPGEAAKNHEQSPRKFPQLLRAMAVLLVLGSLIVKIAHWFLPLISPWEFALFYLTGSMIVLVSIAVGAWVASFFGKVKK